MGPILELFCCQLQYHQNLVEPAHIYRYVSNSSIALNIEKTNVNVYKRVRFSLEVVMKQYAVTEILLL
jgi:hypothetical protein